MKKLLSIIASALLIAMLVSCGTVAKAEVKEEPKVEEVKVEEVKVEEVKAEEVKAEEVKVEEPVDFEYKYTYSFADYKIDVEAHNGYGYVTYPTIITDNDLLQAAAAFTAAHGDYGIKYQKDGAGKLYVTYPQGLAKEDFDYIAKLAEADITWYINQMIAAQQKAAKEAEAKRSLENAASFLKAVYDKTTKANPVARTAADFTVNDIVIVDGVTYSVTWTTDTPDVVAVPGANHAVLIDVNEKATAETQYTLTATITNPETKAQVKVDMLKLLPKGKADDLTYEQIVAMAYTLAKGEKTAETYRLYGTVTKIPTPWDAKYQNVTVDMVIEGLEDYPIEAYRLAGEGADKIKVGDKITVEGILTRYNNTYEFNSGCKLIGFGNYPDQHKVVESIFQLTKGEKMADPQVIAGKITSIASAWSDQYGNISVYFAPYGAEDKIMEAYRLTGEGAKNLKVGDEITVYGLVKRYNDTFEFDTGCVLVPNDCYNSVKNILHGYALETGKALDGTRSIKGTVISIPSAYSASYGNITINMVTAGIADKVIQAYRLAGGSDLKVGDTITVTGIIKNYNGTIEFDKNCTYVK